MEPFRSKFLSNICLIKPIFFFFKRRRWLTYFWRCTDWRRRWKKMEYSTLVWFCHVMQLTSLKSFHFHVVSLLYGSATKSYFMIWVWLYSLLSVDSLTLASSSSSLLLDPSNLAFTPSHSNLKMCTCSNCNCTTRR